MKIPPAVAKAVAALGPIVVAELKKVKFRMYQNRGTGKFHLACSYKKDQLSQKFKKDFCLDYEKVIDSIKTKCALSSKRKHDLKMAEVLGEGYVDYLKYMDNKAEQGQSVADATQSDAEVGDSATIPTETELKAPHTQPEKEL